MTDRQPTTIHRRAFLSRLLTTTSLVAAGMALRPSASAWAVPRRRALAQVAAPPTSSGAFANPPLIAAGADGGFALDVRMRQVNLGSQALNVRGYVDPNNPQGQNAPLVGPTITLSGNGQPVQNVAVRLNNRLPLPPARHGRGHSHAAHGTAGGNFDTPHGFDTTNLHTHGLHVAPAQDNVYVELAPGLASVPPACFGSPPGNPVIACQGTYTYRYTFGQAPVTSSNPTGTTKLPAGTYWYHPHKHGSVGLQVASGMAGAFIVYGDLDAIPGMPPVANDAIMVVQLVEYTIPATPGTASVNAQNFYFAANPPPANTQMSINGQINPTMAIGFGAVQRWRVVNATSEQFFYLNLVPASGTTVAAPQLYAIAVDGVPLTNSTTGITVPYPLGTPSSSPSGFADTVMNEIAVLAPGQRLDLLVQMPSSPTSTPQTYQLQAVSFTEGTPSTGGQTIATIVASGPANAPLALLPASSAFNAGALYRPPLTGAIPTTPTQNIQFGFIYGGATGAVVNNTTNPAPFGVSPTPPTPPPLPAVPAKPFALPSPAQIDLKLNNVDLWQVSSGVPNGFGPHAFHIHINSFMMTQRNGVNIAAAQIWRDTVRIDQGTQQAPLPVRFVSQQVDYTGDFVLHCHVLQHEDAGMMWSVSIST